MTIEAFYGPDIARRMRDPLPEGYASFRMAPEYIRREGAVMKRFEEPVVGRGPNGVRWHYGPLRFERFEGDTEPMPDADGPLRFVVWQRTTRTDRPRGWWPGDRNMGPRAGGIIEIGDDAYQTRWRPHARRQMRKWEQVRAQGLREIVEVDLDAFLAAYADAEQTKFMKWLYPKVVRDKARAHGPLMRFWGSRRLGGPIDTGLATVDVPERSTSIHLAAFIGGTAKDDGIGTGLIDEWFQHCRERGIQYIDMGYFWSPGDLDEYKGFSRFKAQFDVRVIVYPRPLIRLAGKWGVR